MPATLTHRALQHHVSCFSIRSNKQSAPTSREDETYYDDGLTPRALNVRRSHLSGSVPSPTRRYATQSVSTKESLVSTARGPLRVVNPDVVNDYHDHRRAAIYVPSPAQQALQRVVTPQHSISTRSSRSRFSSFGSEVLNTVKRRKPKRKASSKASTRHDSFCNPLRVPTDVLSERGSASAGDPSRSVSLNSCESSIAEPQTTRLSVIGPFSYAEPAAVSLVKYPTPRGVACAKLEVQSFTTIYGPDDFHYSPAVSVWAVATIKCVEFLDGEFDFIKDTTNSAANNSQLLLRSYGQIENLVLDITVPEAFEVSSILGRLQHRQVLLGSTCSTVFKLLPQQKLSMAPKAIDRASGRDFVDPSSVPESSWVARFGKRMPIKVVNDRLMDEVEQMLMPEEELTVQVQYSHTLFPNTTIVQETGSCRIKAITESERRQRQVREQRGQTWRQQRGIDAKTMTFDLDRDLQMANAICTVLQDGIGTKWPKTSNSSVQYTTIPPSDALQLLYDFREATGAILPHDVIEEMDRLEGVYRQVLKERQERSLTRKSLKVASEMGHFARRAIPTSSTFLGRYSDNAFSGFMRPLNPQRTTSENRISNCTTLTTSASQPWDVRRRNAFELDRADYAYQTSLKDITNDSPRRRGVARLIDTLPIVGRRKNTRAEASKPELDLEKGIREEDQEIEAIWRKVRIISGASSTISDDMERINESKVGGPPWM